MFQNLIPRSKKRKQTKQNNQPNKLLCMKKIRYKTRIWSYNLARDCYPKSEPFCCWWFITYSYMDISFDNNFIKRMKYLPTFWRNFIRFVWNFKLYNHIAQYLTQKIGRKVREACNEASSMVKGLYLIVFLYLLLIIFMLSHTTSSPNKWCTSLGELIFFFLYFDLVVPPLSPSFISKGKGLK
jgi:hypothetical protein